MDQHFAEAAKNAAKHIPTPPDTDDAPIQPDHQAGAFTNCICATCQEIRLGPDGDHRLYTPHDMADAWRDGWLSGHRRGQQSPGKEAL